MKKRSRTHNRDTEDNLQEKISKLSDDLMEIMNTHIDYLEEERICHKAVAFFTMLLAEHTENDKQTFKILKMAIEEGLTMYNESRGE